MAAKGYFDALVKLGELASDSQGSKELGEREAAEGPCCEGNKKSTAYGVNKVYRVDVTAGVKLNLLDASAWEEMKTRGNEEM